MASVVYIEVSSLGRVVCVGLEGPAVGEGDGSGGSQADIGGVVASRADSVTGNGEGGTVSGCTGLVGSGGGLFVSGAGGSTSSSSTRMCPLSGDRVGSEPPS